MYIHMKTYPKDSGIESHIRMTNNADHILTMMELSITTLPFDFEKCTVVRERGSLPFASNTTPIPLGNLYPNETAHLYYILTSELPLEEIEEALLSHIILSYVAGEPTTEEEIVPITAPLKDYYVAKNN